MVRCQKILFEILAEYQELFDELGEPEILDEDENPVLDIFGNPISTVLLRKIIRTSAQTKVTTPQDVSLYKPIVDDPKDRTEIGVTSYDRRLFKIWGGVFDTTSEDDADDVRAAQLLSATEDAFNAALIPGGGILYHGVLHPVVRNDTPIFRGFTVRGVTMIWYLVTERTRIQR